MSRERVLRAVLGKLVFQLGIPLLAFVVFLALWTIGAQRIETKYGTLPTPAAVWDQGGVLLAEHQASRRKERAFHAEQTKRADELTRAARVLRERAAKGGPETPAADLAALEQRARSHRAARYAGNPTFIDQIITSLKTVLFGFLVASLIAIPLGILCGLSRVFAAAVTPFVQLFKPVSPLAWLPIVMIVVGALYTTPPAEAWFEKSFLTSALTVALCCMWPTLMNTALGVSAVHKDHQAVAQVLGLSWSTRVRKIVVPSALPFIFAGLRISLGVGWMVLIAAEMLAQNPGLGKFIWDMFQNGSSQTLAQIMVAVFTIGVIGFLLDRTMVLLQRLVSYEAG